MLQQMKNALSRWREHKYALAILALGRRHLEALRQEAEGLLAEHRED